MLIPIGITHIIPSLIFLPMTIFNMKVCQIVFNCWNILEYNEEYENQNFIQKFMNFLFVAFIIIVF